MNFRSNLFSQALFFAVFSFLMFAHNAAMAHEDAQMTTLAVNCEADVDCVPDSGAADHKKEDKQHLKKNECLQDSQECYQRTQDSRNESDEEARGRRARRE